MARRWRVLAVLLLLLGQTGGAAQETDLPPLGRSDFDRVVGAGPVPFPFSRLLARLEAGLVRDGLPPLKTVLIPLGRSLQRSAAAPDYFRYPRVVVAVDGENQPGAPFLKDRLFLGYQEKGEVLEVISYNEQAGRFEFQVVRDYRPAAVPRVFYARRSLCLACHQNGAPLFARPLWDETSANPAIAARLRAARRDFYGIPVSGTDLAYLVDAASDRANLFSVWQTLWQQGCGPDPDGARCRAELFAAALGYGLSGALPADLAASFPALRRNWPRLWPRGLAIPNPDIPNRDPLAILPAAQARAGIDQAPPADIDQVPPAILDQAPPAILAREADVLARLAHIPARFEPLQPRPPLAVWHEPDRRGLVAGLAGLLERPGLDRLERLLARAESGSARVARECALSEKGPGRRLRFRCPARGGASLAGHVDIQGGRVAGRLETLALDGASAPADLALRGRAQAGRLRLEIRHGKRPARLSDGRRLEALEIGSGRATLTLRDDFAQVRAALERMRGQGRLAARPFGAGQLDDLLLALGGPPAKVSLAGLPPARVETRSGNDARGPLGLFRRHCGACHDTAMAHPPNFLHGDERAAAARLAHCAQRIYYRLAMWSLPEPRRGKTPMPPPAALAGYRPGDWARSADLASLRGHAEQLLAGAGMAPATVLARPFEELAACLPAYRAARP